MCSHPLQHICFWILGSSVVQELLHRTPQKVLLSVVDYQINVLWREDGRQLQFHHLIHIHSQSSTILSLHTSVIIWSKETWVTRTPYRALQWFTVLMK